MNEESDEDEKTIIKYGTLYGYVSNGEKTKFWDDFEEMGEEKLLDCKIIQIKIYIGTENNKKVVFGIGYTLKNRVTGRKLVQEHKGSFQFDDVKVLDINDTNDNEYLSDFHIRFPEQSNNIYQLGLETNKKNKILGGTEEGENKTIETNGGDNIIVGFFGHLQKTLEAIGYLYITKKDYIKRILFKFFIVRHKAKKDVKFNENWNIKYKDLPTDFQFIWKTVNLPDACFFGILKYCFI